MFEYINSGIKKKRKYNFKTYLKKLLLDTN